MVIHTCILCNYNTSYTTNYQRHIISKKHLRNSKMTKKPCKILENPDIKKCIYCHTIFSSMSNLNKHILKFHQQINHEQIEHNKLELENMKLKYENEFKDKLLKEKEKCIEVIKDKNTINHITTNNTIHNNQRITIDYLNKNYNNVITMDEFKKLVDKQKVPQSLADYMEVAFNSKNIHEQSNVIAFYAKDVCKQNQIEMLPLICTDSNLRSYKEKTEKGWEVKINNDNIVYIIDTTYKNTMEQYPDKNFNVLSLYLSCFSTSTLILSKLDKRFLIEFGKLE